MAKSCPEGGVDGQGGAACDPRSTGNRRPNTKKGTRFPNLVPRILVRLAGIEPTTPWFVAKYSIQLSYSRTKNELYQSLPEWQSPQATPLHQPLLHDSIGLRFSKVKWRYTQGASAKYPANFTGTCMHPD
jgi:hypothetical protein